MTEWKVAPSYQYSEIAQIDEENKKALIIETCERCGGSGMYIIPNIFMGTCFKCNGHGKLSKWVKAYTPEEYDKYMAAQKRAKEKREAKREAEIADLEAKSEENKKELLAKWGYDTENPCVYIITGGNTYDVKEEIKESGGRYNSILGWYYTTNNEPPQGFITVSIPVDDLYDWNSLTKKLVLKDDAETIVTNAIDINTPDSPSNFVGEIKERMRNLKVTLVSVRPIESRYGCSTLFTFDYNDNILVWFTTSPPDEDHAIVGHEYLLTATVKDHKIYQNIKQTLVNRCVLKEFAN